MTPIRLSRLRGHRFLGVPLAACTAVAACAVIGAGSAVAATAAGGPGTVHAVVAAVPGNASSSLAGCVNGGRTGDHLYTNPGNFPGCPAGESPFSLSSGAGPQGPAGPAGPQGPKGATGAAGPSGVVSTGTTDLGGVASVATGGSFVTNATQAGTISLHAGTYLVSVNAKATPPAGGTGAVQVFPQFFIYNQPANAAFTGDLFNVGAGALESGVNSQIDSYYSGSTVITLPSAVTLHLYAFGYDSDRGAGSFVLDDLTVTVTQVIAAA